MNDQEFVSWLTDRMVQVYGESPNVDFVHRARAVAVNIESQAREIERLEVELENTLVSWGQVRLELAAMKCQPSGVVLPDRRRKYLGRNAAIPVREAVADGWQLAVDSLPAAGKPVLAYYLNSHGMSRRIRAEYVKAWTVQADDLSDPDTECVEYSEQEDSYYIRQGWYELIDNWDEYGRIAVHEGVITHWMQLPAAPSPSREGE